MGFESLHQQVIDSSKMIVTFVLERLQRENVGCDENFITVGISIIQNI